MQFIEHYLVAAGLFVLIDALWIGVVANKFYKSQLGSLLADKPKFGPAVLFYLLYLVGLVIFVINPALGTHSFSYAVSHGALLGLCMYATYDLTNLSTLKKWPLSVTMVDLVWGTFITTVVGTLTFVIFR